MIKTGRVHGGDVVAAREHEHGLTADAITDQLRQMILTGVVGVGVQLKQEALAKRLGVSRFPIREALQRLQAEGLVTHTPNAGSVVTSRTLADLIEIVDIRIGLETRALELSVPNMQPADFKAAKAVLTRYDASDLPREWTEFNLEFHMCLYRPSGRVKLVKMIEDIVRSTDIQLRSKGSSIMGRRNPQAEHKAILAACMDKNTKKATQLLQHHLERTQRVLLAEKESTFLP